MSRAGEIHGIAHDRVRRSEPRADLDREHVATVHADAHRQLLVGIDDGTGRAQHAALVVLSRDRNAGGEDHLAAVRVEVGREERHRLRLDRALYRRDHLIERLRHGVGAVRRQEGIDTLELDETDGRVTVLALDIVRTQVLTESGRL